MTAGAIIIEPARRRHLAAMLRIEQQASPRPWSEGTLESELRLGDTRRYLVARSQGRVVGFGGLMLVLDDGHVTNIAVDPQLRRRGVATRLLVALLRDAIDAGVTRLSLEVRASNDAAQALYRRFGFAPAGARRGYYPGPGPDGLATAEDAIVMWANDVDGADFADRLDRIEAALPDHAEPEKVP